MPESHINDPTYYRNWAEEIRTLSGAMNAAETRAQMIRLAESYDKLAERAAQRVNRLTSDTKGRALGHD